MTAEAAGQRHAHHGTRTAADTFPKLLVEHASRRGDRAAIREKSRGIWRTTTWRGLADEVAMLAAGLSARGVKRGSHVALAGDNRPRLFAAMCAAQVLGAIAVPLYQDAAAGEMAGPIAIAEATHVFAENQEQVDKILSILPRCPSIQCIVFDEDRGMRHYRQPQLLAYAALLEEGRAIVAAQPGYLAATAARGAGSDAAFIFFTSGTAGPSRGVVQTHAALIDRAHAAAEAEKLEDTDVTLAYLPPAWIGQNLFGYALPLVVGHCVACPESSETLLADMREMGPTYLLAPPRVLKTLLTQVALRIEETGGLNQRLYEGCMAHARRVGDAILAGEAVSARDRLAYAAGDLLIFGPLRDVLGMGKVRAAYCAGDAIDPQQLAFFRALGINMKQLYGSTETGFFVAMQRDGQVKPGSVGAPAPGVELKITPRQEILVRSPGLFREYHRDPETTASARDADGWFHTDDAGYLGEDGHLRVVDCLDNVGALRDGTPHAPRRIENKLKLQPYIREAVAFGQGRDRVCALVDIDTAAVGRWADRRSISYTGHADLASLEEVQGLIAECVARVNAVLALDPQLANAQIHRFAILRKELDADDGLLTRTGKLRRDAIAGRFAGLVEALYGAHGTHAEEVNDAQVFPPASAGRAA